MTPPKDKKPESPWLMAFNPKVIQIGGSVGLVTIVIVLMAVFGGIWLDNLLGTKPLFTVSLVLASVPLSLVLIYFIAIRAVKDLNLPPTDRGKNMTKVEEEEE